MAFYEKRKKRLFRSPVHCHLPQTSRSTQLPHRLLRSEHVCWDTMNRTQASGQNTSKETCCVRTQDSGGHFEVSRHLFESYRRDLAY